MDVKAWRIVTPRRSPALAARLLLSILPKLSFTRRDGVQFGAFCGGCAWRAAGRSSSPPGVAGIILAPCIERRQRDLPRRVALSHELGRERAQTSHPPPPSQVKTPKELQLWPRR